MSCLMLYISISTSKRPFFTIISSIHSEQAWFSVFGQNIDPSLTRAARSNLKSWQKPAQHCITGENWEWSLHLVVPSVMLIVLHVVRDFGVPETSQTKVFLSLVDPKSKHFPTSLQRAISPQTTPTVNLQLLVSKNLTSSAVGQSGTGQLLQMQRTFGPSLARQNRQKVTCASATGSGKGCQSQLGQH